VAVATSAKANGTATNSGSNAITVSTGPITVDPGESIIIFHCNFNSIGLPANSTISDSDGRLSWTEINPTAWKFDTGANPRLRTQAWIARNNFGSQISTIVTASNGGGGAKTTAIAAIGITGNSTQITNFSGAATNASGDPAPSLASAPAASSAVVGCGLFVGSSVPTAPAGFSELQAIAVAASRQMETIHVDASPAQSAAWSTGNTTALGVLIEVPAATAAANQSAFMQMFDL
jgi:hypothetical protein